VLTAEGIKILASPPQAPAANAIREKITATLRPELSDRALIINEHPATGDDRKPAAP
jgi:putative transposase